jgi:phosphoribosylaminoimidazole-succinocarboxamide synthase
MSNEKLPVVLITEIPGLVRLATGKVRDVYEVGNDALLLVATDRISAFDVVMDQGIPDKGRVLTQLSVFWFELLARITPNHLITADGPIVLGRLAEEGVVITDTLRRMLAGRVMLCRRTRPLPIEAVVRGYLSGSAWKEYRNTKSINGVVNLWGVSLPGGLVESDKLPQPVFTPSTKAITGHDLPMFQHEISGYIGDYAEPVEQTAIELYQTAAQYAAERGILLADTKFEFGTLENGALLWIDEALTPDSSRFWEEETYAPGGPQPSFDKQFLRDFLETVPGWNKQYPPPALPDEIVEKTAAKYRDAYHRLTGKDLS